MSYAIRIFFCSDDSPYHMIRDALRSIPPVYDIVTESSPADLGKTRGRWDGEWTISSNDDVDVWVTLQRLTDAQRVSPGIPNNAVWMCNIETSLTRAGKAVCVQLAIPWLILRMPVDAIVNDPSGTELMCTVVEWHEQTKKILQRFGARVHLDAKWMLDAEGRVDFSRLCMSDSAQVKKQPPEY